MICNMHILYNIEDRVPVTVDLLTRHTRTHTHVREPKFRDENKKEIKLQSHPNWPETECEPRVSGRPIFGRFVAYA